MATLIIQGPLEGVSHARSFKDRLNQLAIVPGQQITASFAETIVEISRFAVRSSTLVTPATAPGFFYRFDPELGVPERVTSSRGPIFGEVAHTIGAGNLEFGFTYLYSDFTEINGESLESALDLDLDLTGNDRIEIETNKIELRSHVFVTSFSYGITSNWDANILLPLQLTSMELRAQTKLRGTVVQHVDSHDEKFGVGDILLRTKYRLPDLAGLNFASLLALRIPTGDEDNFQGLGNYVVTPQPIGTRTFGPHDIHASFGIDINATFLDRSAARCAVGGALQVFDWLAIPIDILGSFDFNDETLEVGRSDQPAEASVPLRIDQKNFIDLTVSGKIELSKNFHAHLGAIFPLTSDGLRAAVIPTGGVLFNF